MVTRNLLVVGVLVSGVLVIGVGTRHVLAQQGAAAPGAAPAITMRFDSMEGRATDAGRIYETTVRGNVVIRSGSGPVVLTTNNNAFVVGASNKAMHGSTTRIPMDLATLQVSVTPSGTIFQDQHGNKLTVETAVPPK